MAPPEFEWNRAERQLVGCGGTLQDITERKLAEEALRQQRERYEFVAEGRMLASGSAIFPSTKSSGTDGEETFLAAAGRFAGDDGDFLFAAAS